MWQVVQEVTAVAEAELASTLRATKDPGGRKRRQEAAARLRALAPQWFDGGRGASRRETAGRSRPQPAVWRALRSGAVATAGTLQPLNASSAIVRAISATFHDAIVQHTAPSPIDVALARVQHARYVQALRDAGLAVTELPPLDAHPDACFVEDCALVAGDTALITRSGAPSRVGEADSIAEALARTHRIERTAAPATIDGGDCLRVGRTWFIGRSARTNAEGAQRVREVFGPLGYSVVEVPVRGFLHLKCVASRIGDGAVLVAEDSVDLKLFGGLFGGLEVVTIPRAEAYAANTVVVNGTALVAANHPRTRAALEQRGLRVIELDMSEFAKADGSLTCLSILLG